MSSYRFCRTDDIGLLVDALNRCWAPYFPDEPRMTSVAFKRSIRDLQVWCSSCMVAFAGSDPIGVLIGAKRASATLVHRIAVHPDHVCQGHGRHMLASLGQKLAILGPPRIVAEVPDTLVAASGLFSASGYAEEAPLTDYVLPPEEDPGPSDRGDGRFVIPVTIDDLAANGLLEESPHSPGASARDGQPLCWERSVETLMARKADIEGLAVASDERIEAYILYMKRSIGPETGNGSGPPMNTATAEIVALRSLIKDGGSRLKHLLTRVRVRAIETVRFPKVHAVEVETECLETLGFRAAGRHVLYAARARSD